jgi:hypothetical protein
MLLSFLLGGGVVVLGVWTGMAASNLSAHFQHKRDVTETPEEKASREAYERRRAAGIDD